MSPARRPERLSPPPDPPVRLTRRAFPPYAYVPGREPHPVTDPAGHSHGVREEVLRLGERELPRDWRRVEEYLYGIDLFNAAFFWEAHESWEAVWHAVARESAVGGFLQGLIQASASLLQRHCGRDRGALNLLVRSKGNLEGAHEWLEASGRDAYMGVELAAWERALERRHAEADAPFPFLRVGL
jgi:hypothetical protein